MKSWEEWAGWRTELWEEDFSRGSRVEWSIGLGSCEHCHVWDLEGGPQIRGALLRVVCGEGHFLIKEGEAIEEGIGGGSQDAPSLNKEVPPSNNHIFRLKHISHDEKVNPTTWINSFAACAVIDALWWHPTTFMPFYFLSTLNYLSHETLLDVLGFLCILDIWTRDLVMDF